MPPATPRASSATAVRTPPEKDLWDRKDATSRALRPANASHEALNLSPTLSARLGRHRLTQHGSGSQIVLYFGSCTEAQNYLRPSEEPNLWELHTSRQLGEQAFITDVPSFIGWHYLRGATARPKERVAREGGEKACPQKKETRPSSGVTSRRLGTRLT